MKKFKNQNAITLIALVITIVVLLILAGVALSLVVGEDGITEKAITASKTYDIAGAKEQVDTLVASYAGEFYQEKYISGNAEATNMAEFIAKQLENETKVGDYDITITGNTVTVSKGDNKASGTITADGIVNWDGWTQDGVNVTKGGQTLKVGTKVTGYEVTVRIDGEDTTVSDWYILGAKGGQLLLTMNKSIENVSLSGQADYYEAGINKLNTAAGKYSDGNFATSVRTIDVDDINRVTKFDPESYGEGLYKYGNEITYFWDGSDKPYYSYMDGESEVGDNLYGTHNTFHWFDTKSKTWKHLDKDTSVNSDSKKEITKLTQTYYGYDRDILTDTSAYDLLFAHTAPGDGGSYYPYWLGSPYVRCNDFCVDFGLRYVGNGRVNGNNLAYSNGCESTVSYGLRPVVSLKSDIKTTEVNDGVKIE